MKHMIIPDVQAKPGVPNNHLTWAGKSLTCTTCNTTYSVDHFPKRKDTKDGYRKQCKSCRTIYQQKYLETHNQSLYQKAYRDKNNVSLKEYGKNWFAKTKGTRLLRTYGITLEEHDTLLCSQDYKCAICASLFSKTNPSQVDHDHVTNKVRGLLCKSCNLGLGKLGDTLNTLESAVAYLRKASYD